MDEDKYYIKISPENIIGDLISVPYTADTYVITGITGVCCYVSSISSETKFITGLTTVYSSMTSILSGGTDGSSLLTGLSIPILFRQTAVDIGYYSVFDGAILQADVVKNFIFSATTTLPYRYYFYNTSERELRTFLNLSTYSVDWGDNSPSQVITALSPNNVPHDYVTAGTYRITLTQNTPWGVNTVKKDVVVPFTGTTISNPRGTAFFTSNIGSWSATPISYDFIFSGDSDNQISAQTSNNYVTTPFLISGYSDSRITELKQYGVNPYQLYVPVVQNGVQFGVITTMSSSYTGYTIEGIKYLDFPDKTTIYIVESSGLTSNWMVQSAMTKNEALMNIVSDPEVQSDIFIERGKNSAMERVERLGEIDNIGDLENYGYGFFNFVDQNNF